MLRLERATLEVAAVELTLLLNLAKPEGEPRVERIADGALHVSVSRDVPLLGPMRLGLALVPAAGADGTLALSLQGVTVEGSPLELPPAIVLKALRSQVPEGRPGVLRGTEGADVAVIDPRLILAARGFHLPGITGVEAGDDVLTLRLG